jgi:hypothetical protein
MTPKVKGTRAKKKEKKYAKYFATLLARIIDPGRVEPINTLIWENGCFE